MKDIYIYIYMNTINGFSLDHNRTYTHQEAVT